MTAATIHRITFTAVLLLASPLVLRADNWPSWRGPDNNGVSKEKGLPAAFSETKNLAWKLPLPGRGSSTPIIWGDRIFLTGAEGNDLMLWCASTEGKMIWKKKVTSVARSTVKKDEGNEASSTPSTDGKHVFVYFGPGDLACYDFEGKEIWKFNVQKKYGKFSIQHGMHITPLLHEDRLYMAILTNGGHWVIAIDKATGDEAWKVARPTNAVSESREAYTSPVLWKNGKDWNLVVLGCDYTTGHLLSDGKEVWRLYDLNPKNSPAHRIIASPVANGEDLVVPTCRGMVVVAVKQGASGTIKKGSPMEQWRIPQGSPDVPSPLIQDGLVYLQRENGALICVDVKSGKEMYEKKLTSERYRASPIFADGKIYTIGRDSGTITVVKAGPTFEQLARNQFKGDDFTASPAVANGRLYLRSFQALYAISEGGK